MTLVATNAQGILVNHKVKACLYMSHEKSKKKKKESNLLMALTGFELPTSPMYSKLAAFTNTAGSVPVRAKTL